MQHHGLLRVALAFAIDRGDIGRLKHLYDTSPVTQEMRDQDLIAATQSNHFNCAAFLLERGADPANTRSIAKALFLSDDFRTFKSISRATEASTAWLKSHGLYRRP